MKTKTNVRQMLSGAARSFLRYPAAVFGAGVIAFTASSLIQNDYLSYSQPLQSLQLAYLLVAALGLAWGGWGFKRQTITNYLVFAGLAAAGLVLFFIIKSGADPIPQLSFLRVLAAFWVFVFAFFLVIARRKTAPDFEQAVFLTVKAGSIALLYAGVLLLGLILIAFAIETLLYENLSSKVYQHIAVWSAFLWFLFFLGYLPDFTKGEDDPELKTAISQPRFIAVLISYVAIPIVTALSGVLLLWTIQIITIHRWPEFGQLAAVFLIYGLVGLWLGVLAAGNTEKPARLYRRFFPPVLLLFLCFQAWAIIRQIRLSGVGPGEYAALAIWLYLFIAALLIVIRTPLKHKILAVMAILILILSVAPLTGYLPVTVRSQTRRLQTALLKNDMLQEGRIVAAKKTPPLADRRAMREAAIYLLEQGEAGLSAPWFKASLDRENQFADVFGFALYGEPGSEDDDGSFFLSLEAPTEPFSLEGYQQAVLICDFAPDSPIRIEGQNGLYEIKPVWLDSFGETLKVSLNQEAIPDVDFKSLINGLVQKYAWQADRGSVVADLSDLSLLVSTDSFDLLIVFQSINLERDEAGNINYDTGIRAVLLGEK